MLDLCIAHSQVSSCENASGGLKVFAVRTMTTEMRGWNSGGRRARLGSPAQFAPSRNPGGSPTGSPGHSRVGSFSALGAATKQVMACHGPRDSILPQYVWLCRHAVQAHRRLLCSWKDRVKPVYACIRTENHRDFRLGVVRGCDLHASKCDSDCGDVLAAPKPPVCLHLAMLQQ